MNRINKKLIEVWGLFLFLGMAFCACPQIVVAQNVQMVKVQGVGQGKTEAEAIKDAIVQAVAQVSGQKLQSNESARESSVESSTEKGRYAAEYQRKTDTSVRGVARSYRVISVGSEGTSGLYKALVEVDVPKFQQSNQLDRFKVAVVARKMSTVPAEFDENFLNAMVEAASEVIVKTHKFAVLDRSENEAVQNEISKISADTSRIEDSVRINARVSADFLVLINILKVTKLSASGNERLSVSGQIQLLDYSSGQIRYISSRSMTGIVNATNGVSRVFSRLAANMASQMMEYGFPSEVIEKNGEMITVDAGSTRFMKNDEVEIFRRSKDLKDSHTGERINGGENLVAKGVVATVSERVSTVKVTEGLSQILGAGGKFQGVYIVRVGKRTVDGDKTGAASSGRADSKSDEDW